MIAICRFGQSKLNRFVKYFNGYEMFLLQVSYLVATPSSVSIWLIGSKILQFLYAGVWCLFGGVWFPPALFISKYI